MMKKSIREIEVEINNLNAEKAKLRSKMKYVNQNTESSLRKKRTRTLIQMGSLIKTADLQHLFMIEDGDDLQSDIENLDKAATLIGALLHLKEDMLKNNPTELTDRQQNQFKKIGKAWLKMKSGF